MRHRRKTEKFSRSRAQKKALVKSLLRAVILNERILTTTRRAKYLKAETDKMITLTKNDSLSSRRQAYRILGNHGLVKKLFEVIGPRFKQFKGGYVRVLKFKLRKGDGAPLSILELTKLGLIKSPPEKKLRKEPTSEEKKRKIVVPKKELKPKKGLITQVRKIFKKERDAL